MGEPGDDANSEWIWLDGHLVLAAQASVSTRDHGLTVGDGIFETMKVVGSEPFAIRRHLERLRRSAAGLGIDVALTDAQLREAVADTIAANRDATSVGRVRVTVTGGLGPLGSGRGNGRATVMVATAPPPEAHGPADVVTVPWRRNEHSAVAGLKTTSYAENVVALAAAHERGADEAIFANTAGNLCEGTGSNVFVGIDGRLVTPPLTAGCLAGITRELLLEHIEVTEEDLPDTALQHADEAFLTSSTRDVQPIATVDGVRLPACPGPLTQAAAAAFAAVEEGSTDP